MQKYLNEQDTLGEIRQARRHPIGKQYLWVLVEGITDQKLYTKLINANNTKVEMVQGGVEKLREVLTILTQETEQVLAIRDADFLHLDKRQESIKNLFLTDVHDSEMMLLTSDNVFEAIVAEYLPNKRNDFKSLRHNILVSLSFLAGMRWLNSSECLKLNFKSGLGNFYNSDTLIIDKEKCISEIEKSSPSKIRSITVTEIDAKIATTTDYYNLCNGHDFEKAFSLHVSKITSKNIKDKDIGSALRIAYRKEDFFLTKLYAHLKEWERETNYVLFN